MTNLSDQLEIVDIRDNLILLKDTSWVMVLETTSVNIDLKSEAEADVLLTHYQRFLQSLTSPIQIIIRIQRVDMDEHNRVLQDKLETTTSPSQQRLLSDYQTFLGQLVSGRNMLTRRFFLLCRTSPQADRHQAQEQLASQKEELTRLLQPMEIKARQLEDLEIANLFYASFQPGKGKVQPLLKEAFS